MQLPPFLLDMWLDNYEHDIEFNLASSSGPSWTVNAVLSLAGEEERQRFLNHELGYGRPAGADGLREAIAGMHEVSTEFGQIVTRASAGRGVLMGLSRVAGADA